MENSVYSVITGLPADPTDPTYNYEAGKNQTADPANQNTGNSNNPKDVSRGNEVDEQA